MFGCKRNLVLCGGHLPWKLGPRQDQCGQHAPSKPKNVGNSSKNASFQFFALSPQNWPGWARAAPKGAQLGPSCAILDATGAQVGANGSGGAEVGSKSIRMHPKLKPYDAHGGPRHVQSGATCIPLATASQEVGPNGDTLTRRKNVG